MKQLVKESLSEFINEKFETETDPVHNSGIGCMRQIKKEMQSIINLYGTGGQLEQISNEDECGYMVELKFGKKKGGTYSITYNYKYGWTAGYEDSFFPSSDNEECENLAEAVSIIEGWIEYAQDNSNDW